MDSPQPAVKKMHGFVGGEADRGRRASSAFLDCPLPAFSGFMRGPVCRILRLYWRARGIRDSPLAVVGSVKMKSLYQSSRSTPKG